MFSKLSSFAKLTAITRKHLQWTNRSSAVSVRFFSRTVDASFGGAEKLPVITNSGEELKDKRQIGSCFIAKEHDRGKEVSTDHFQGSSGTGGLKQGHSRRMTKAGTSRAVVHIYPDGTVYEGDLYRNRRHGQGKYVAADKTVYEGSWVDDKKHGPGKQTSADGRVLEGEWRDGKMYNGSGVLVQREGGVIEGTWVEGKMEGQGKCLDKDGYGYVGNFHQDNPHGKGMLAYQDGAVYEGEFQFRLRHGQGKYVAADKTVYEGSWVDDEQHGPEEYLGRW